MRVCATLIRAFAGHLVGPHATAVIDYLTTRNAHAIAPGRSQYACLLSEQGKFVEDAVLFRMGPNSWMVRPSFLVERASRLWRRLMSGSSHRSFALSFAFKLFFSVSPSNSRPHFAVQVVHGGGSGHELLAAHATGRNCALLFDDDMHDLSLQGPKAIDLLARHVPGIRDLPYFAHTQVGRHPASLCLVVCLDIYLSCIYPHRRRSSASPS